MSTSQTVGNLQDELIRIKANHGTAIRRTASRVVLGSSVIRVFEPGTKPKLQAALDRIDVDRLHGVRSQGAFKEWFARELGRVARVMKATNRRNSRVNPGYKWGHGTKVLCLWVRDIVLNSRYFPDATMELLSPWLYAPVDSVVIKRLRELGVRLPFRAIKEIDTARRFFAVQDTLAEAAKAAGVPRIWFDDNWGDRQA